MHVTISPERCHPTNRFSSRGKLNRAGLSTWNIHCKFEDFQISSRATLMTCSLRHQQQNNHITNEVCIQLNNFHSNTYLARCEIAEVQLFSFDSLPRLNGPSSSVFWGKCTLTQIAYLWSNLDWSYSNAGSCDTKSVKKYWFRYDYCKAQFYPIPFGTRLRALRRRITYSEVAKCTNTESFLKPPVQDGWCW